MYGLDSARKGLVDLPDLRSIPHLTESFQYAIYFNTNFSFWTQNKAVIWAALPFPRLHGKIDKEDLNQETL